MARTSKPDFKPGDKVLVEGLKSWRNDATKATVVTAPYKKNDVWVVGIRYWEYGEIKHDIAPTVAIVKIRRGKMKLSKPALVTAVVLGVLALLGLWLAGNYNSLVRADNAVQNSKSKIDTELTRRYDLIDNIVSSVEGSQAQESDVFGKIAEARKVGGNSSDPSTQAEANNTIDTQIALLPRLQEAYPELRSNDQVSKLIAELQGTNNTIRDKRNDYNDTVTNYNNNITAFPKSIFANIFGFDKAELFEATGVEKVNPKVEINPNER